MFHLPAPPSRQPHGSVTHNQRRTWPGILCGLALLTSLLAGRALGQAETTPRGHGFGSLFFSRHSSTERFDFNGQRTRLTLPGQPDGRLLTSLFMIQGVYGLTDRLEAEVLVPIVLTSEIRTVGLTPTGEIVPRRAAASGIANARFNIRYNFRREPFFVTARFGLKTRANSTRLQQTQSPILAPIDEGTTDIELAGQLSRRWGRFRLGGEAGLRLRGNQTDAGVNPDPASRQRVNVSPANEFIYSLRAGYQATRRISLFLLADGLAQGSYDAPFRTVFLGNDFTPRTVGTRNPPPGVVPDLQRQTGRRLFKLGPFASFAVTPRTILTGGIQFAVAGQNTPTGTFVTVGISRLF
jgi:hypothetical protein